MEIIQRLLAPTGERGLADVVIAMPEPIAEALREVFSFDVGGCNELEGDKIYKSLQQFAERATEDKLCVIRFLPEELGERMHSLYAIAPIENAEAVIDLIEDQIDETPQKGSVLATGMRDAVLNDTNTIGWYDLKREAFIFTDISPAFALQHMFGITDAPHINRFLEYEGEPGMMLAEGKSQMSVLANAWQRPVEFVWNGKPIIAHPDDAPSVP